MTAQHGTNGTPLSGLPPWVLVGISTFVAFVLGFVVMVELVYRFHSPPAPVPPASLQREETPPVESPPIFSPSTASAPLPSGEVSGQGIPAALPQPPAWIVVRDLSAPPELDQGGGDPPGHAELDVHGEAAADQGDGRSGHAKLAVHGEAGADQGGGRSGRAEPQPNKAMASPELAPHEQVAAWRRQNAWVILLVRYGYEQEAIAERTWQRLRDKVPAGLRLVRVESHDHREWLLLLGAFSTQEAAQEAAQQLPPELIVRRPHLQVVAVRYLF